MLFERSLPIARRLARRYQRADEPFDDVFQVACLGLVKAIDRFDVSREVAFSSYAVRTILGEIKRYFRDRTWSVHVPRDVQELSLRVETHSDRLATDLPRLPTVSEIARAVGPPRRRCSKPSRPQPPTARPRWTAARQRRAAKHCADAIGDADARFAARRGAGHARPAPGHGGCARA